MPNLPNFHRRSIRLKEFDYSRAGAYFITLCAHRGQFLFGKIIDGKMQLNNYGEILQDEWLRSPEIRSEVDLDMFVVMPNHLHGIVFIQINDVGSVETHCERRAHRHAPLQQKPKSLSSFVAGFKSEITKRIRKITNTPRFIVWQRNYYEHVVRNGEEMNRIRQYITDNPLKWELDRENPKALVAESKQDWEF